MNSIHIERLKAIDAEAAELNAKLRQLTEATREANASAAAIRDEIRYAQNAVEDALKALADAEAARDMGQPVGTAVEDAEARYSAAVKALDKLRGRENEAAKQEAKAASFGNMVLELSPRSRRLAEERNAVLEDHVRAIGKQAIKDYIIAGEVLGRALARVMAANQFLATLPDASPDLVVPSLWSLYVPAIDILGALELGRPVMDAERARQFQPAEFAALCKKLADEGVMKA